MTDTQPSPLQSPQPPSAANCGTFATRLCRASQSFQFWAAATRTLEPASPAALRWNPPANPVETLVLWLKGDFWWNRRQLPKSVWAGVFCRGACRDLWSCVWLHEAEAAEQVTERVCFPAKCAWAMTSLFLPLCLFVANA